MNKLLMNNKGRNHIRFFPMQDSGIQVPEGEKEQIEWARARFKELQTSPNAKRLALHKNKAGGYLISVWELDGLYYLVQCLRNEFGTYNDTIYISKDRDDMVSIAKFLKDNITTIVKDYKDQILEARDALLREAAAEKKGLSDA